LHARLCDAAMGDVDRLDMEARERDRRADRMECGSAMSDKQQPLNEAEQALVAAARAAMMQAHAPYSKFAVGAAVRLTDGTIITGSNFENASYGLSLCAETVAIACANAQGRLRDIAAIAVMGGPM